jgi:RNA polymerase sigma factor (sigma-70 family)
MSKKKSLRKGRKNHDLDLTKFEVPKGTVAELVIKIQASNSQEEKSLLFNQIIERIDPLIKRIVGRFNIPGYEQADLYQEALLALRFKAIEDFDPARCIGDEMVGFEKFAALCTKRHLSTILKTSFQNKQATLNFSVSFSAPAKDDEGVDMSSLVTDQTCRGDIFSTCSTNEVFHELMQELFAHLSDFEKLVLALYSQRNSYEEIAQSINKHKKGRRIGIKSVDNALSRIKAKAKTIIQERGMEI